MTAVRYNIMLEPETSFHAVNVLSTSLAVQSVFDPVCKSQFSPEIDLVPPGGKR